MAPWTAALPLALLVLARRVEGKHVVVVGAGMSGLAVAGRLARAGVRVTVLEKNERELLGGRLGELSVEAAGARFRFETGASLLLLPRVYAETFEALGARLPDLERVRPAYRVFLDDDGGAADERADAAVLRARGPIDLGGDEDELAARLALEVEEPEALRKVHAFFAAARAFLACGLPLFIEARVRTGLASLPQFVAQAIRFNPLGGLDAQLRGLLPGSARLRALLSFDTMYVGLSPTAAPAVFSLLAALACDEPPPEAAAGSARLAESGVWYRRGGFHALARELGEVVEGLEGVHVRYGCACARITTTDPPDDGGADGGGALGRALRAACSALGLRRAPRATGVELSSGERIAADAVVCTVDLAGAEPALLGPTLSRSAYDPPPAGGWAYSSSAVTLLWGVRRRAAAGSADDRAAGACAGADTRVLRHHNVFLAAEPGAEGDESRFRAAWAGVLPDDGSQGTFAPLRPRAASCLNMYVCVSARTDPSAVSDAAAWDNLMVLVPAPALDEGWSEARAREHVDRWVSDAREAALRALERAGCDGLRDSIVHETVIDPLAWRERHGLRRGAVFGLAHGLGQLSVLRPAQTTPLVRGVHFAGASTAPGNGVPLVLISAAQVSRTVQRELQLGDD